MSNSKVRVRFAPSPTGGLHLGGVRTVLYNYLFAKRNQGDFVLRIEDTDQTRFVEGAEQYIYDCLQWVGLEPDESPQKPGKYGPYRQSERKPIYKQYADQLVANGQAYIAFDTPEELERMRVDFKTEQNPSPQYDRTVRNKMRNSLTLSAEEVQDLLDKNARHVIRIKMPDDETIRFTDMVRGVVEFNSSLVDDKVLLKADGMPTYHLAVVVDDYLMEITHAFRGEEWLPSSPVHVLLWQYLFGLEKMPQWAHLPLILGPSGKLSKRDGAKYGFPVFAMNWTDAKTNELTEGFREKGFLPEAFINMLALLGWNDGTEQELFSKEELIEKFSIERVHSGGAKFDYEKAKWFNQEWLKTLPVSDYAPTVKSYFQQKGIAIGAEAQFEKILELVKERVTLLPEFIDQSGFFFQAPSEWDMDAVKPKWNETKTTFFKTVTEKFSDADWEATSLESSFKDWATAAGLKPGEVMLPLRIMLVGGKFGPHVFDIALMLGRDETVKRINTFLEKI